MLQSIQKVLATNEVMSETMLANKLGIATDALAPMMKLLQSRGIVELVLSGDCSGGCGCVSDQKRAYRWLGQSKQQAVPLNIIAV